MKMSALKDATRTIQFFAPYFLRSLSPRIQTNAHLDLFSKIIVLKTSIASLGGLCRKIGH